MKQKNIVNLKLILEIDETEKYCELEIDIRNREIANTTRAALPSEV